MESRNISTPQAWRSLLLTAMGSLTFLTAPLLEAAGPAHDSYTWSAELVDFDAAARTITVKSLVVGHADRSRLAALERGERAMLTWSGVFSASGVRSITPGAHSDHDRFTMPVEFVATEMDGQYVQFSVPIPSAAVPAIESLAPGDWVTATSPHRPTDFTEAVSAIRPYNDVS